MSKDTNNPLKKLPPELIKTAVVDLLLGAAAQLDPHEFRAFLVAANANTVVSLTDDYWRVFTKVEPCGQPGCDCHEMAAAMTTALEGVRKQHRAQFAKATARNN